MFRSASLALSLVALGALAASCGDDGGERRTVQITQTDEDCTPNPIELKAGEKVKFEVHNEGKKDKEVEGIEGTKLEELLVPAGKTRNINYTAPKDEGTAKIKCYVPGGSSTILEIRVAGSVASNDAEDEEEEAAAATDKAPNDTITTELSEYEIGIDKASVAAGPTKFVAKNTSASEVHELAVLRVKGDNDFENMGEIEDLDPGKSGEIVLDLPKGEYLLACLIVPGQEGSKVDHFQQGMKTEFRVQ